MTICWWATWLPVKGSSQHTAYHNSVSVDCSADVITIGDGVAVLIVRVHPKDSHTVLAVATARTSLKLLRRSFASDLHIPFSQFTYEEAPGQNEDQIPGSPQTPPRGCAPWALHGRVDGLTPKACTLLRKRLLSYIRGKTAWPTSRGDRLHGILRRPAHGLSCRRSGGRLNGLLTGIRAEAIMASEPISALPQTRPTGVTLFR